MANELAKTTKGRIDVPDGDPIKKFAFLVEVWLSDKTEATRKAYQDDLRAFSKWAGHGGSLDALVDLFSQSTSDMHMVVETYKLQHLRDGYSAKTINRRLSTLKSLSKRAVAAGLAPSPLVTASVRGALKTPVRPISAEEWDRLVAHFRAELHDPGTRRAYLATRDIAMVRLLRDVGLRRKELCFVRPEDVDFPGKRITIAPKGERDGSVAIPVDGEAWECVIDWLEIRHPSDKPLFLYRNLNSINKRLETIAHAASLPHLTPHMFRRAGITGAVAHFGGYSSEAVAFARHADPRTTAQYDYNQKEKGIREVQKILGSETNPTRRVKDEEP